MNQRFEILSPLEPLHEMRRYLARRRQGPGVSRLVILTRLPRRLSEDSVYLAEQTVLTAFRHKHVAAVLELQSLAGELYLTQELCAGASLAELVVGFHKRDLTFPAGLIGRILRDIALAIDDAHHFKSPLGEPRPVSHRDLSLPSVVVTYEGVPKIVDYGHPRPAMDTASAFLADLASLNRLVEQTGSQIVFGPLHEQPDARQFAATIEKNCPEPLWGDDEVAHFVKAQFPKRMERLRQLSEAEAIWSPEEDLRRMRKSTVRPLAPAAVAEPAPAPPTTPEAVNAVPAAPRTAPNTSWLRKYGQTALTSAFFGVIALALLTLQAGEMSSQAKAQWDQVAQHAAEVVGQSLPLGWEIPSELPWSAVPPLLPVTPSSARCGLSSSQDLSALGLTDAVLLEPLEMPQGALTRNDRSRDPSARRLH